MTEQTNLVYVRTGIRPVRVLACCAREGVWVEVQDGDNFLRMTPRLARDTAAALVAMAARADEMNRGR